MREKVVEQRISFKAMINNSRLDQFFDSKEKKEGHKQDKSQKELDSKLIESKDQEIEELLESEIL
ncbi:MAG: hypothetical protein ACP5OZ_05085 [Candidatus Woesearchaeota archaeon]